jgi:hypothetical protein
VHRAPAPLRRLVIRNCLVGGEPVRVVQLVGAVWGQRLLRDWPVMMYPAIGLCALRTETS